MASLQDVLDTIYNLVIGSIYPNGTSSPSVTGVDTTIVQGFPVRNVLDTMVNSNKILVSVFPTNLERVVTKFLRDYSQNTQNSATIITTVNEATRSITISGSVSTPQVLMVLQNGIGYAYSIQPTDTLNSIAQNAALLIPNAFAVGDKIFCPMAYNLNARISVLGDSSRELSRQERVFLISAWCPSPTLRAQIIPFIDEMIKLNTYLILPDNYYALMWQHDSPMEFFDNLELSRVYRADLRCRVQYATTQTISTMTIADTISDISTSTSL